MKYLTFKIPKIAIHKRKQSKLTLDYKLRLKHYTSISSELDPGRLDSKITYNLMWYVSQHGSKRQKNA